MKAVQDPNIVQASSVGAREANEDRIGCWTTPDAVLMAVADGLGGHAHGEIAAQIAIDILGAAFAGEARARLPDPPGFLARAMGAAHAAILREAGRLELPETPRTVLAACVVQDGHVFSAHVGDCRFYLLRKGRIVVRTRDHSVVQRLVDEGRIREEAAGTHPYRNRLLRCLGGYQAPHAETAAGVRLAREDIVLLCSDGFWGPLTQRQLMHALLSQPLDEALPGLVRLAEASAGRDCDNISVIATMWNPGD